MKKRSFLVSTVLMGTMLFMSSANSSGVPTATDIAKRYEQQYSQRLTVLRQRSPEKDADAAAALGFPYLLGYHKGRSAELDIPGVDPKAYAVNKSRCPTLIMDGMGDVIYGNQHMQYRKAMTDYAVRFNRKTFAACLNK